MVSSRLVGFALGRRSVAVRYARYPIWKAVALPDRHRYGNNG